MIINQTAISIQVYKLISSFQALRILSKKLPSFYRNRLPDKWPETGLSKMMQTILLIKSLSCALINKFDTLSKGKQEINLRTQ
jgi:hypothetical protein